MGRFVFYSNEPGEQPLILEHNKMKGTRYFEWGKYDGYSELYDFCRDILGGTWKPAEAVLIRDSYLAYNYAVHRMKKRWTEAEPVIRQDDTYWLAYCDRFEMEITDG